MASSRSTAETAVLFAVMALAWAGNYLFVKVGLPFASPLWLAALRAGTGAVGVAVYLVVRGRSLPLSGRDRRDALLLGIPNTALFLALWFIAAGQVGVGEAAVVIYTYPIWVALFTAPLLGARLSWGHWLAVAGGFSGVFLVSEPWTTSVAGVPAFAFAELLLAAVCWAAATVLFQRRFRPEQLAGANGYQLLAGSVVLLLSAVALPPYGWPQPTVVLLVAVLWLGLFGTAVAYVIWFWLLEHHAAPTVSAYLFLVPLGALGLGVAFDRETVSWVQAAGIALVLVSIYAVPRRKEHAPA